MALTTSDEIQKQLTVIFGYNGQLQLETGYIIGIGKLSARHTEILIRQMLHYQNAYNAMLRDYAGCELYSIEFELENLDKAGEQLKILPKSMLFIPGEYKDCNTLLLLLSNEMSLLDHGKAKNAVDHLSELYFEAEEAANRSELTPSQKLRVLNTFAKRFAYKLQGNVIEGKWNRKLVGLKTETETEEEMQNYLTVNMNRNIRWDRNKEIVSYEPKMTLDKLPGDNKLNYAFLKHMIFPSTANVIAEYTFRLTTNLMQIANTGTIDDLQEQLIIAFLQNYLEYCKTQSPVLIIDHFVENFQNFAELTKEMVESFKDVTLKFVRSGDMGSLQELLDKYKNSFPATSSQMKFSGMLLLAEIFIQIIKRLQFASLNKVRAIEFESNALYMIQCALNSLKLIHTDIAGYMQYYLLTHYAIDFINLLFDEFKSQRKPLMALGFQYIEKFAHYLQNAIMNLCYNYTANKKSLDMKIPPPPVQGTQKDYYPYFQTMVKELIPQFMNENSLEIIDVMHFVEMMVGIHPELNEPIQKLKDFPKEIRFLWKIILRHSTINRFIRELPENEDLDPVQFIKLFSEYLTKRLGGFKLKWTHYMFHWMDLFAQTYQPKYVADYERKQKWPKGKIIDLFIQFLDQRIEEESTLDGFKKPMKQYLNNLAMNIQYRQVNEILKAYDSCLEILIQFPDFIKQSFIKNIAKFQDTIQAQSPAVFLGEFPSLKQTMEQSDSVLQKEFKFQDLAEEPFDVKREIDENNLNTISNWGNQLFTKWSFHEFLIQTDLKYFSKLIAKPSAVVLTAADHESFDGGQLFFRFEFKHWEKFIKMYVSSNFQKIKPKF